MNGKRTWHTNPYGLWGVEIFPDTCTHTHTHTHTDARTYTRTHTHAHTHPPRQDVPVLSHEVDGGVGVDLVPALAIPEPTVSE